MTNERPVSCYCGHPRSAHGDVEAPKYDDASCTRVGCDCVEFQADAVCSHCGEAHDPDVSASIAEELS